MWGEKMIKECRMLVLRPEGKRELGKPSCSGNDNIKGYIKEIGTAVAQWLRCCTSNRKVAGSIPDGVFGIFH